MLEGEPEDIARAVVFLASEDASWITGQVLQSSGGLMLQVCSEGATQAEAPRSMEAMTPRIHPRA